MCCVDSARRSISSQWRRLETNGKGCYKSKIENSTTPECYHHTNPNIQDLLGGENQQQIMNLYLGGITNNIC